MGPPIMQPTATPIPAPVTAPAAAEPTPVQSPEPQIAPVAVEYQPAKSVFDLFADTKPVPAKVEIPPVAPIAPTAEPEKLPELAQPDEAAELEALIAQFRAEHPEAPDTFIKRLADKEAHIKKQSSQITELLARVTKKEEQPPAPRPLTPFEQSLQPPPVAPAAPPAVTAPPVAPVAPVAPPAHQEMLPAYMESPEAAEAAYAEAIGNGDYRMAGEIRHNIDSMLAYQRRSEIEALARQQAEALIQKQFGQFLPTLQQQAAEQQANEMLEFAVSELETRGLTNIRNMFVPVDDTPLESGGRRWANTPMNQTLAKYPFLQQINVQHPDPTTARKLTLIARYEAAASMMPPTSAAGPPAAPVAPGAPTQPQAGITPEQAQALVQAGREQAQREEQDRIRAAMNGGRLPAGAADGKDQVGRLTARSGSWADMFRSA